jgi:AraC-like DNA-binding protein
MELQDSSLVTSPTRSGRGKPLPDVTVEPAVPLVLALVRGRKERARVLDALQGRARLTFSNTVQELGKLLRETAESELLAVLVEPRDGIGVPVAPFVKGFIAETRLIPVIAICDAGIGLSRDVLDLAQAGTHEVVVRGLGDDGHILRQAIETGQRTSAGMRTLALLMPQVPEVLRGMVEFCVYYPGNAKSVNDVARALCVHRKTLVNYCSRAQLPPPAALISWCRVLHAAVLLTNSAKPIDHIARLLDFQSGSALRNMFRRYTGMRPGDARDADALRRVVATFRASVGS